jgi:hypothetical protein
MHVFLLILAIAGQPERIAAVIDDTNHEGAATCNRVGAEAQAEYLRMFNKTPDAFSYRCVPAIVAKVTGA